MTLTPDANFPHKTNRGRGGGAGNPQDIHNSLKAAPVTSSPSLLRWPGGALWRRQLKMRGKDSTAPSPSPSTCPVPRYMCHTVGHGDHGHNKPHQQLLPYCWNTMLATLLRSMIRSATIWWTAGQAGAPYGLLLLNVFMFLQKGIHRQTSQNQVQ